MTPDAPPPHVRALAGRPPRGVPAAEWHRMVWDGACAIAEMADAPNEGTPEEYAAAALRGALAERREAVRWRVIAGILAERVYHNAECATHPDESKPGDGCPFCKDRAAYRLWERKSGKTHRDPPVPADQMVNVFDLVRRDRAAGMPASTGEAVIDE